MITEQERIHPPEPPCDDAADLDDATWAVLVRCLPGIAGEEEE